MNTTLPESAFEILNQAKTALNNGELQEARRLALKAVKIAPEFEEPWLYLASVSSPKASITYLKKALEINPSSKQAKKGMKWAIQRYRKSNPGKEPKKLQLPIVIAREALTINRPAILSWSSIAVVLIGVVMVWLWTPDFSFALPNFQATPQTTLSAQENVRKVTYTPTPTNTPTPTLTPTSTPTPTITPTPKPTKVPETYPSYIKSRYFTALGISPS